MEDKYTRAVECQPRWKRIDKVPPPRGVKCLFKGAYTPTQIGVWYEESGWIFWCGFPDHSPEDKEYIKSLEAGAK